MSRGYEKRRRRRKGANRKSRRAAGEQRAALVETVESSLSLSLNRSAIEDLLHNALDQFAIEAGKLVAVKLLEDEVEQLCGPRHEWGQEGRTATRYGHQGGYICLGGQKVPIERPRVRAVSPPVSGASGKRASRTSDPAARGELPLSRYAQLQQNETLPEAFLRRMVRGVSTRDYEGVIDLATEGCGVKKSSVSRGFVRASAKSLQEWSSRSLAGTRFAAVFIDGVEYASETMVVALGITANGHKQVLGMRQGATENATVVTSLLEELHERGLDVSQPTLFVLDGAKALVAGVKKVFGKNAIIQRCQIHKRRNVEAHLPKKHHAELKRRMAEAYHGNDYDQARERLRNTVAWLRKISPDAASSLAEGLEETLTVVRLGVTGRLRRTLSNTNVIESALSVTRTVTARVKRWRDGTMRKRWCAAGLIRAEEKFRRVKGHRDLPQLIRALEEQAK